MIPIFVMFLMFNAALINETLINEEKEAQIIQLELELHECQDKWLNDLVKKHYYKHRCNEGKSIDD